MYYYKFTLCAELIYYILHSFLQYNKVSWMIFSGDYEVVLPYLLLCLHHVSNTVHLPYIPLWVQWTIHVCGNVLQRIHYPHFVIVLVHICCKCGPCFEQVRRTEQDLSQIKQQTSNLFRNVLSAFIKYLKYLSNAFSSMVRLFFFVKALRKHLCMFLLKV